MQDPKIQDPWEESYFLTESRNWLISYNYIYPLKNRCIFLSQQSVSSVQVRDEESHISAFSGQCNYTSSSQLCHQMKQQTPMLNKAQ